MLTFKNLQDRTLNAIDESGDTSTTLTLTKQLLNEAHAARLVGRPWNFMLWPQAETFTITVGTRIYTLHSEFALPLYFRNRTTKGYCVEVPIRGWEGGNFDWNNTSSPARHYVLTGRTGIQNQPTSSSTLSIVSTSASDTTAAKGVTIRGVTTSGTEEETLTPNGTTTVTGTKSFSQVLSITKGASWAGTLTVSAGSVTVLKLLPDEFGRSYQQIEFLESPSQVDVIEYRFYRLPRVLENDNDIPDLPYPFSEVLVYDALLLYCTYNTELDGRHMKLWQAKRDEWEMKMEQQLEEGNSLNSAPRFIRDLSESYNYPTIYR